MTSHDAPPPPLPLLALRSNSFLMTTSRIVIKCQYCHKKNYGDDDDDGDDDDVRALLPLLSTVVEVKV